MYKRQGTVEPLYYFRVFEEKLGKKNSIFLHGHTEPNEKKHRHLMVSHNEASTYYYA